MVSRAGCVRTSEGKSTVRVVQTFYEKGTKINLSGN
jgi:hypothetical protein